MSDPSFVALNQRR